MEDDMEKLILIILSCVAALCVASIIGIGLAWFILHVMP
jgi:hypothetical protein